jgi:hypothetical protein
MTATGAKAPVAVSVWLVAQAEYESRATNVMGVYKCGERDAALRPILWARPGSKRAARGDPAQ